jgi:hypothetical protein
MCHILSHFLCVERASVHNKVLITTHCAWDLLLMSLKRNEIRASCGSVVSRILHLPYTRACVTGAAGALCGLSAQPTWRELRYLCNWGGLPSVLTDVASSEGATVCVTGAAGAPVGWVHSLPGGSGAVCATWAGRPVC